MCKCKAMRQWRVVVKSTTVIKALGSNSDSVCSKHCVPTHCSLIYLFLAVLSLLLPVGFLQLWLPGPTLGYGAWSSHCRSRVVDHGLLSVVCVDVMPRFSCSLSYVNLPPSGIKPLSLHCRMTLTTAPPGKPCAFY